MSKPFHYWLRLTLVSSLSVLLSFNPAFAGRILNRAVCSWQANRAACENPPQSGCVEVVPPVDCGCTPSCVSPTVTSDCVPMIEAPAVAIPDCGCQVPSVSMPLEYALPSQPAPDTQVESAPSSMDTTPSAPSVVPQVNEATPAPSEVKPSPFKTEQEPEKTPSKSDSTPAPEKTPEPAPTPMPEPAPTPMPEPAPKSDPAPAPAPSGLDDLFGNPQPKAEPTPMPEAAPAPAPAPAPSGLDDLFGNPQPKAEPAPMPEAAPSPAPSGLEDLFGNPPAKMDPVPAPSEPAPAPAASGLDDLFGTPSASAENMPAPSSANATDKPASSDDLFGTVATPAAASEPAAPTPPPAAAGFDDLFGTPAEAAPAPASSAPESAPKDKGLDDLFNMKETPAADSVYPPVAEPAKPLAGDKGSTPDFDQLFGSPSSVDSERGFDPKSANEPQTPDASDTKKNNDNFDDLFKTSQAPSQPEFRGAEFRTWTDNTGDYQVKGRLVMIYPDRIRLLKENGKHTTVPYTRLSGSDQEYVNWVAVSLTGGPKAKFVNTDAHADESKQEITR